MILEGRGYHLRTAPNGPMALDAIGVERPDVVLVDMAMRRMSGVELCRRIRSFSRVPILVLSARVDEQGKVEALDAGADGYVTKPFAVEELLARIRVALRRAQAQRVDEAGRRVGVWQDAGGQIEAQMSRDVNATGLRRPDARLGLEHSPGKPEVIGTDYRTQASAGEWASDGAPSVPHRGGHLQRGRIRVTARSREVIGIRDLGVAPCAHVLQLIERRRAEVSSRIRELQQLEQDLARLAEEGAGLDPAECDPAGICKIIPSDAAPRHQQKYAPVEAVRGNRDRSAKSRTRNPRRKNERTRERVNAEPAG